MSEVASICEGVFGQALTRGRRYLPLAIDEEKRQVRLEGDNGVRYHIGNRHLVVVSELSELVIEKALGWMNTQGELEACTMPLEGPS